MAKATELVGALDALGVSKEELLDSVVQRIAEQLLSSELDYEGNSLPGILEKKLRKLIDKKIDESVDRQFKKLIAKEPQRILEDFKVQPTEQWGEPKGKPIPLKQFLFDKAQAYVTENVDYNGKTLSGYDRDRGQSRLLWLIDKRLHESVEDAVKKVFMDGAGKLSETLQKATKSKLEALAEAFTVKVVSSR